MYVIHYARRYMLICADLAPKLAQTFHNPSSPICLILYPWRLCAASAVQKIKELSETPATVPIVAKLCFINSKNRKITKRFVQPVTPGWYPKRPFYNVKMNEKWPILNII